MADIPSVNNVQAGASQQSDGFTQTGGLVGGQPPAIKHLLSPRGVRCVFCGDTAIKVKLQDRSGV